MALLSEYAVTPDVFDVTSYTSEETCGLHLQILKDVFLHEGLVRDLRDGDWGRLFLSGDRAWHGRGKELLKKLGSQKRLVPHPPVKAAAPATDADWCGEALASHVPPRELAGIIVSDALAGAYKGTPIVAGVGHLPAAAWWSGRSPSVRVSRTLAAYQGALALLLRHANHLMFVDPHVDPSREGYAAFGPLLQAIGQRKPAPLVEVHRACYRGSGVDRQILKGADIEGLFRQQLAGPLAAVGLAVEVFIWDDFHHRCVVSDLVGILMDNGFDTTKAPNASALWSRLGRDTRDDVVREFDPAFKRHVLHHRFKLP